MGGQGRRSGPPVAHDRLTPRSDGTLELARKSVWKDGTRAIVFAPEHLVLRLIAARKSSLARCGTRPRTALPPARGDQLELGFDLNARDDDRPAHRNRCAWLLAHVFRADLKTCIRCGGPMRWVKAAATVKSAAAIRRAWSRSW